MCTPRGKVGAPGEMLFGTERAMSARPFGIDPPKVERPHDYSSEVTCGEWRKPAEQPVTDACLGATDFVATQICFLASQLICP